ncbi:hypothetical protein [Fodinibius salsisoli]|uniref:Uncharacterized protein n=1 Tax=Fodinibius salsisoli TaxID=2820877 RepID=A0ABT3PQA4_9BACT|nr:hypothetical protein [Fodinibius salsisoli]MCW9708038.1 hypothetical protein [Fodinibius salsisoli]
MMLISCSLLENNNGNDETRRTYPEAYGFELSTVYKMKTEVEPPDSLDVNAYVTAVFKCPDNAACFVPDGIMISDSLNAQSLESQIHLTVEKPLQFTEDQRYRMSLDLSPWPGNGEKRFRLLGYSVFNNKN